MPLTQDQENLAQIASRFRCERELKLELMKVQTENYEVQLALEPWKLLALGIGAGLMGAAVGIATVILRALGVGG